MKVDLTDAQIKVLIDAAASYETKLEDDSHAGVEDGRAIAGDLRALTAARRKLRATYER